MKKIIIMFIAVFAVGTVACLGNAATVGYIDSKKVFSSYDKTKKAQDQFKKKEKLIQDEIEKKQKQYEKAKSDNMSDGDLRKLIEKFENELEPKKTEITELKKKLSQEIQNDIIKVTEATAKKMGLEIVLDKQSIVAGGTDITDEVIRQLNK